MNYYLAEVNRYQNGQWLEKEQHMFKSARPPESLSDTEIVARLGIANFNTKSDCLWWDRINESFLENLPEV